MKKVLLIEDNIEIRENVSEILTMSEYNVLCADNGDMGVELAKKEIPDVILCDIMMPQMNGYEVFAVIKENPLTKNIPFVFMSGLTNTINKCKGLDMGAEDYLFKPFDDIELIAVIRNRINRALSIKDTVKNIQLNCIEDLEDFIRIISHGVRNPLCSNLGLMQLLEANYSNMDAEDLKKTLEGIKKNTLLLNDFTVELSDLISRSVRKYKD